MESFKELDLNYIDVDEHESYIAGNIDYQNSLAKVESINDKISLYIQTSEYKCEISQLLTELFEAYMTLSSVYRCLDFKHSFVAGITIGLKWKTGKLRISKKISKFIGGQIYG